MRRPPTAASPPVLPPTRYVAMKSSWSHGEDRRERERERGRFDRGANHSRRSRSPGPRRLEDDEPHDRSSKSRPISRHDRSHDRSQERRRRSSRSPLRQSREREEVRERNRGRELLEPRGSDKPKRSSHHSPSSSKRRRSRSISPSRSHHRKSRRSSFRSPSRPEKEYSTSKHDRRARATSPPPKRRVQEFDSSEIRVETKSKATEESRNTEPRGRSTSAGAEYVHSSRRNSITGIEAELSSRNRDSSLQRSPERAPRRRDTSPFGSSRGKSGKRERYRQRSRSPVDRQERVERFGPSDRSRHSSPRENRGPRVPPRGSSPRREKSSRPPPREDYHSGSKRPRSSGGRAPPAASGANSIEVKMSGRGYYGGQQGYNANPMQAAFPLKPQYNQGSQGDPRYSQSPQHMTPNSHHGSPQGQSPYSGSWGNQQQQQYSPHSQYPPNYQQAGFSPPTGPQNHYYNNQAQSPPYQAPPTGPLHHQPYPQQNFRGNQRGFRGNHYNSRGGRGDHRGGRGGHHYGNLQWNSGGNQGAGRGQHSGSVTPQHSSPQQPYLQQQSNPTTPQHVQPQVSADGEDGEDLFRPSKIHQVEDTSKTNDEEKMPPPSRPVPTGPQSQQTPNKFSFAFKASSKAAPTPPKPEISSKLSAGPARPIVPTSQASPERPRGPAAFRGHVPTEPASARRQDFREPAPEVTRKVKKTMKREKARPQLSEDFKKSTSVYYRKMGNESVVGSGTYGKVYKAVHVYTKELVALKKIRMEGERDGFPVTAVREIKLLQSLKHENVVTLKETMVESNDCFMVFEYAAHDLTGLLNHPTFKLEPSHKKHLAKQLFVGLEYLHKRGVLHRDIKAANILVSNTGQLKLADFGLARFYEKRKKLDYTNRVITIWYRPPELLFGETQYGPAVDIWSAACVLVEIFTRHAIFPGDGSEANQLEKLYAILGTPNKQEWPGLVDMQWFQLLRPNFRRANCFAEKYRERVTPAAFELLSAMFQYDPDKRPSASDVLEHPYFATEQPAPKQASELSLLEGDWHEFESKALRKENERKDKEARRQAQKAAAAKDLPEKDKRPLPESNETIEPEPKRLHIDAPSISISDMDIGA
ncbi:hypothetical protein BP5796_00983 [Coleophoma crateriformis]|uniref:cyclin-dependent kinase n=1 Tax=Coleophoma crateriformis TaxID=565419 RepID=A0A3D8T9I9_9HELO|nr:hypothetical protein BP5796_00983 [Coleophoma crateriformis]